MKTRKKIFPITLPFRPFKYFPGCVKYATLRILEIEEDSFELRILEEWSLKD